MPNKFTNKKDKIKHKNAYKCLTFELFIIVYKQKNVNKNVTVAKVLQTDKSDNIGLRVL